MFQELCEVPKLEEGNPSLSLDGNRDEDFGGTRQLILQEEGVVQIQFFLPECFGEIHGPATACAVVKKKKVDFSNTSNWNVFHAFALVLQVFFQIILYRGMLQPSMLHPCWFGGRYFTHSHIYLRNTFFHTN